MRTQAVMPPALIGIAILGKSPLQLVLYFSFVNQESGSQWSLDSFPFQACTSLKLERSPKTLWSPILTPQPQRDMLAKALDEFLADPRAQSCSICCHVCGTTTLSQPRRVPLFATSKRRYWRHRHCQWFCFWNLDHKLTDKILPVS